MLRPVVGRGNPGGIKHAALYKANYSMNLMSKADLVEKRRRRGKRLSFLVAGHR
jgi:hypothetical protein